MRFFVAMFSHEPGTPSTIRTDRARVEARDPVDAAGKQLQHAAGIGGIDRLAEDCTVDDHLSIGAQHEPPGVAGRHQCGFLPPHAPNKFFSRLARVRDLGNAGGGDRKLYPCITEQFGATGRGRGQYQCRIGSFRIQRPSNDCASQASYAS